MEQHMSEPTPEPLPREIAVPERGFTMLVGTRSAEVVAQMLEVAARITRP
jgi:hypothetical protein